MVIGITVGDPSGIGPEVLLKSFRAGALRHPVAVFGDIAALEHYNELLGLGVRFRRIAAPGDARSGDTLDVVDHGTAFDIAGRGLASHTNLLKAVDLP